MSSLPRVRLQSRAAFGAGALWLGYAVLTAALIALYIILLVWHGNIGVDFACFRAASLVLAHGGNPYDFAQLWRAENALYNAPQHLAPGAPSYYALDRYYNPPLFATALAPLAVLPFAQGYAVYAAAVLALAAAGTWLTLLALGWTRLRLAVVAVVLVSPCVFLAVWNGQQSTLLLFALGGALYALRRGHPAIAGALLALGWVKPHLLVPVALALPLLLPAPRATLRAYGGFAAATALGVALTVLTSGAASLAAWLHTLFGYTGYVDAIQNYMPSLGGMALVVLPHPYNRLVALALMALGVAVMAVVIARARRAREAPWGGSGILVATWLLFTPFAHANDDVLLLLPLAMAWGSSGARGLRPLPLLALWAFSALPLAVLLPRPWSLVGVAPAALALIAALEAQRASRRPIGAARECAERAPAA